MQNFFIHLKRLIKTPITMRKSLIYNMTLLIIFISAVLFLSSTIGAHRGMQLTASELIKKTVNLVEDQLNTFFNPITTELDIIQKWSSNGHLNTTDLASLLKMIVPFMEHYPQISSINTGDEYGVGYMILRDGKTWLNRIVNRKKWGNTIKWIRWDKNLNPMKQWTEISNYDPRNQPWYSKLKQTSPTRIISKTKGLSALPIYWTKPYIFYTTKEPGITASTEITSKNGRKFVIALDVFLRDISAFTISMNISKNGKVFVLTKSNKLIGLPKDPKCTTIKAQRKRLLKPLTKLGALELSHCCDTWLSLFSNTNNPESTEPFPYKSNGKIWWGELRPFFLNQNQYILIGVVIPQSDLLGNIYIQGIIITIVSLGAILIAFILSHRMAKNYSEPIVKLVKTSKSLQNLELNERCPIQTNIKEINQLTSAQEKMRQALNSFARYVPTDVVRELLHRGEAAKIGGRIKELTILFTDIQGFTTITEAMTPDMITAHLADYFKHMLEIIQKHHGTVDKFIGDAIVAFWGAPSDDPKHTVHAVRAVNELRKALYTLNTTWQKEGKPPLYTRFGISTGTVLVGNVGTPSRLNYTALGDAVNIASRLEGINKFYTTNILASQPVYSATNKYFIWRKIDQARVWGKTKDIAIYELFGTPDEVSDIQKEYIRQYENALELYQAEKFNEALSILVELSIQQSSDMATNRLLTLCRKYIANPPLSIWTGITEFTQK